MGNTLRLMIFTLLGVIGVWFLVMTIDLHLFLNTNIDAGVSGSAPINRTDIGDRCGIAYRGSNEFIEFKLNTHGQIVYLCPQGISPIRGKVTAITITDTFKKLLTPLQLLKVNQFYAPEQPSPFVPTPQ